MLSVNTLWTRPGTDDFLGQVLARGAEIGSPSLQRLDPDVWLVRISLRDRHKAKRESRQCSQLTQLTDSTTAIFLRKERLGEILPLTNHPLMCGTLNLGLKAEYVEVAEEHLKTCRYKDANFYFRQRAFWQGSVGE